MAGALAGWLAVGLMAPVGLVAFIWAALLPVEVLRGVPPWGLDLARYLGVLLIVLRVPRTASFRSGRWRKWAILLVGFGAVRIGAAAIHLERADANVGLVVLVGAVGALLVAIRPALLRQVLRGFVAGATLTASVVLLEVVGLRTIGGPLTHNRRYPGLSAMTSTVTWPLALGVVVAAFALLGRPAGLLSRRAGLGGLVTCSLALVACGAQGGLVGLLVAAAFTGREAARAVRRADRWMIASVIGGILLVTVVGLHVFAVDGFVSDKGLANETSRSGSWIDGLVAFRDHPWVGVPGADYRAHHAIRPHSVVVEASVAAGILGVVLAVALCWQLFQLVLAGRSRPDARLLGAALAAMLLANTFSEAGTFTGLARVTYVLLAVGAIEEYRVLEPAPNQSEPSPVPEQPESAG